MPNCKDGHLLADRWHNQLSRESRSTTQSETARSGSRKPSQEYLMMSIRELRNVIIVLLASSMMLAQSDSFRVKPHIDSSAQDIRQIVETSIAATQRHWQERLRSTYVQRDENRRLDSAGRVKSKEIDVSRTILVNGTPFEQLVERNGQPPSVEEEQKQKEKIDKLKRETSEQRAARVREQEEQTLSLIREVPKAFDFQFAGEEVVNGRPANVLQATPRSSNHAQGRYGAMFSKVAGKLWVDKQDLGWIKVDGQVIQPFSIGLLLARVLRGSHIMMEQTRVDDRIWMPARVEVRAATKIFFVKSLMIERVLTYSEYRLAEADVPATQDHVNTIPSWTCPTTDKKPQRFHGAGVIR